MFVYFIFDGSFICRCLYICLKEHPTQSHRLFRDSSVGFKGRQSIIISKYFSMKTTKLVANLTPWGIKSQCVEYEMVRRRVSSYCSFLR